MKSITVYLMSWYDEPQRQFLQAQKPTDRDLELGLITLREIHIEAEPLTGEELDAAIQRGTKQRQALAKQHNHVPMYIRDKELAA